MSARPGKIQSAFTSGELSELLPERYELKYRANGLAFAQNVIFAPQGGFKQRPGLKSIGALDASATRLFPFKSSVGNSYDLVFSSTGFKVWDQATEQDDVTIAGLSLAMLPDLTVAQQKDVMLVFHEDLAPQQIKILAPNNWQVADLAFKNIPSYDYGGVYVNGVAAVWELEFYGMDATHAFTLTVNAQTTISIDYDTDMLVLAAAVQTALLALSNVAAGLTVASVSGGASGKELRVTFAGADNIALGDGWAISGSILNEPNAAILARKTTIGVSPGEDVISASVGWPACGAFINERLLMGGLKSLKGSYMWSVQGDYFNFDTSFDAADAARLVPMDTESGEQIVAILNDRNPVIMTDQAEYWLAERTLSASDVPNHVETDRHGSKKGVAPVKSEGAQIYTDGGILREYRYTDVNGNYLSDDVSLLASHLVNDIVDMGIQRSKVSTQGNLLALIEASGEARLVTLLRKQEVTAFGRLTSKDNNFLAASANGRGEMSFIIQRNDGRRLERFDEDLLLDDASVFTHGSPTNILTGLARYNGLEVWVVADNEVFGPFDVSGGIITLPIDVSAGYVGLWTAPKVITLPLARLIGPGVVIKARARIHSVHVSLLNTTSIALAANGGKLREVNLHRFGMKADVPELLQGVTETIKVRGFSGYVDEPSLIISQLRPGRLHVRSITLEANY